MENNKFVVVSGGFDPVHKGHLRMFKNAKSLGDKLIVVLNNDDFLLRKKGFIFMGQEERKEIIEGFECVDEVVISIDKDLTVCKTLEHLSEENKVNIFANGGDRRDTSDIPESKVCKEYDIQMIFNIGGDKVQSSSDLVKNEVSKPWGMYRTFEKSKKYLLKRITVNAGQSLSLQSHEHRSEFWIVVNGQALVSVEDKKEKLEEGETIFIPLGSRHRLENITDNLLELVEIQFGSTLSEDDIIRYEDVYGRQDS